MVNWDYVISYPSVRFVRVRNKSLALLYYAINFAILLYVIVYSIIINKAYQEADTMIGTTAVKLKGAASTGTGSNITIYDSIDLTIPPIEQGAFFVTTNFIKTANQMRGTCEGNDAKTELCANGCPAGTYTWNGMRTGRCGQSGKYCEVMAWCPTEENDDQPRNIVSEVKNWSVFSKIDASFPAFGVNFNNVKHGLQNGVNLFTIGDILNRSGTSFEAIAAKGAIVMANIYYRCDLDYSAQNCDPTIRFDQIDQSSFSSGFNFRYAVSNTDATGVETRTLYKVMGVRVIYHVAGEAGRFNLVNLMIALGAGAALLGVSSFVCDIIMQYCLRARNKYTARKYLPVNSKGEPESDPYDDEISNERKDETVSVQVGETTPLLS